MSGEACQPFRSDEARAEFEAYARERAQAWPVAFETRVVETASARTFVRISGRPGDPPLVLLPGARVTSLMWIDTIAALSARHRTCALDTAGDAGFSVSRREVVEPDDLVRWLEEVLEALFPGESVNLLGLSLGGAIAGQYAVRHPDRLRSLVLLAPGATVLPFALGFYLRFALLSLPIRAFGRSPLRRTCRWLFEDAVNGDEARQRRAERAIDDAQRVVRVFGLRPPPWPPVLSDEQWRNLRVPCLFLVGENEKIYSARAAVRRLQRVAPQVHAEIVPGAGHDLTMVHPDLVAQKVVDFLIAVQSTAAVTSVS
jgi:pimeloyl-ACP methyl ester carboxylesterase